MNLTLNKIVEYVYIQLQKKFLLFFHTEDEEFLHRWKYKTNSLQILSQSLFDQKTTVN